MPVFNISYILNLFKNIHFIFSGWFFETFNQTLVADDPSPVAGNLRSRRCRRGDGRSWKSFLSVIPNGPVHDK